MYYRIVPQQNVKGGRDDNQPVQTDLLGREDSRLATPIYSARLLQADSDE